MGGRKKKVNEKPEPRHGAPSGSGLAGRGKHDATTAQGHVRIQGIGEVHQQLIAANYNKRNIQAIFIQKCAEKLVFVHTYRSE